MRSYVVVVILLTGAVEDACSYPTNFSNTHGSHMVLQRDGRGALVWGEFADLSPRLSLMSAYVQLNIRQLVPACSESVP